MYITANSEGAPYFDDILASADQCLFLGTWSPFDYQSNLHFHTQLELGICLSGRGVFYIQGEVYPFSAGDISLIYPHENHIAQSAKGEPSNWMFLTVDTERLFGAHQNGEALRSLVFRPLGTGHVLSAEENRSVLDLMERMITLYNDDRRQHNEKLGHYAAILACILYESAEWKQKLSPSSFKGYDERAKDIQPAVQYIINHYSEDVRIEQLMDCCHLSSAHLRRLFDLTVGISPIAFLHKIRINHACSALRDPRLAILTVSEQCGYSSLSSFNRQFRKWMNCSPSEYREMLHREFK